jgi:hypothetical protein
MANNPSKRKSAKKLMKDLFDMRQMTHPVYLPLIYSYASKISQVPLEEMLGDSLKLSKGLIMAQGLFGYDGIFTNYDNYLEIGLLGDSFDWVDKQTVNQLVSRRRESFITGKALNSFLEVGRVSVVYESAAQLCEIVGRETPVIGVINSPVTLVNIILGDKYPLWEGHRDLLREPLNDARAVILDLIKAYCNHRVDAIWLIEEDWSKITESDMEWLSPLYHTFWKVTEYYDVKSIMAFHNYNPNDIDKYFSMGSDGVFFGGKEASALSAYSLAELVDQHGVCVGIGCPFADNNEQSGRLEELLESIEDIGHGFFLSTPWEVDLNSPVELIHKTMDIMND